MTRFVYRPHLESPKLQSLRTPTKQITRKCCTSCSMAKKITVWYKNSITGERDSVCGPCYTKDLRMRKARAISATQPLKRDIVSVLIAAVTTNIVKAEPLCEKLLVEIAHDPVTNIVKNEPMCEKVLVEIAHDPVTSADGIAYNKEAHEELIREHEALKTKVDAFFQSM